MQQMLYASDWADTTCATRAFDMFWIGPAAGLVMWLIFLIRFRKGAIPYLWLVPIVAGLLLGLVSSLARTTTNVYLEGDQIVHNTCRIGKAYQERAALSQARFFIRHHGKGNATFLDIYWPGQAFVLSIPLASEQYLANLQKLAPDQINAYLRSTDQP